MLIELLIPLQHYDDGELLLPPPRPPAEHRTSTGLENGALTEDRNHLYPHHHNQQGSVGSEAELQSSYVVGYLSIIYQIFYKCCIHIDPNLA